MSEPWPPPGRGEDAAPGSGPPPGYGPPPGSGLGPPPGYPPPYGPPPGYGPPYGPPPGYPPPYGPPPGYPPPPYGYGSPQTEGTAIAALVLAIASFVICPVVPAIVALVLAQSAKRNIEAARGQRSGHGLVTAARIIAWINIGLAVLVVFLIVLIATLGTHASSTGSY